MTANSGKSQKKVGFASPSSQSEASESESEKTPSDSEESELPDVKQILARKKKEKMKQKVQDSCYVSDCSSIK